MYVAEIPKRQKNIPRLFVINAQPHRANRAMATMPEKAKVAAPLRLAPAVTTGLGAETVG